MTPSTAWLTAIILIAALLLGMVAGAALADFIDPVRETLDSGSWKR